MNNDDLRKAVEALVDERLEALAMAGRMGVGVGLNRTLERDKERLVRQLVIRLDGVEERLDKASQKFMYDTKRIDALESSKEKQATVAT